MVELSIFVSIDFIGRGNSWRENRKDVQKLGLPSW